MTVKPAVSGSSIAIITVGFPTSVPFGIAPITTDPSYGVTTYSPSRKPCCVRSGMIVKDSNYPPFSNDLVTHGRIQDELVSAFCLDVPGLEVAPIYHDVPDLFEAELDLSKPFSQLL